MRSLRVKIHPPGTDRSHESRSGARSNIRCFRRSGWRRWPPTSRPDDEAVIEDEHVSAVAARRSSGPRRHPGLHHQRAPRLRDRGPLPGHVVLRRARRPARDVAAGRGRAARGRHFPRPWRADISAVPRRLPRAADAVDALLSTAGRTLDRIPPIRRDLINRRLTTSSRTRLSSPADARSTAISATRTRSSPAGASFYTQRVDDALAEIERLPGRHLYFLDDHLLGDRRFAARAVRWHARDAPALPGRRDRRFDPPR